MTAVERIYRPSRKMQGNQIAFMQNARKPKIDK